MASADMPSVLTNPAAPTLAPGERFDFSVPKSQHKTSRALRLEKEEEPGQVGKTQEVALGPQVGKRVGKGREAGVSRAMRPRSGMNCEHPGGSWV